MSRTAILLSVAILLLAAGIALHQPNLAEAESGPLPPRVLWAWERAEDLRFLDPATTGVAFLAGTIRLSGDVASTVPRLQPLAYPETTVVLPVIRLETSLRRPASLSREQREQVVDALLRLAGPAKPTRLQIDFDARRSERRFYTDLLHDLRERLPRGAFVSITALASWCLDDPWIRELPVDEAVPMLFRMGIGDGDVRRRLAIEGDFRLGLCRKSAGVSTDESPPAIPQTRRRYLFHPAPWSPSGYQLAAAIPEDPS